MQKPLSKIGFLIQLLLAFVLPWLVSIGSINALEAWLPGKVKVDHWRHLSSASFIVGGVFGSYLILKIERYRIVKAVAPIVLIGSFWLAFMFQLRSNCGDEGVYIGEAQVAGTESCK